MEHPCEEGTKVCISSPVHMTKMATLPINGKAFKTLLQKSEDLKLGMDLTQAIQSLYK